MRGKGGREQRREVQTLQEGQRFTVGCLTGGARPVASGAESAGAATCSDGLAARERVQVGWPRAKTAKPWASPAEAVFCKLAMAASGARQTAPQNP